MNEKEDAPVCVTGIIMRSELTELQRKTGKNHKESIAMAVKAFLKNGSVKK